MAIPKLYDLTLPLLRVAVTETSFTEAIEKLAGEFKLTPQERSEMLPSGADKRFGNRVRWAKVELGMAELVENTKPKHFRATEAGQKVLAQNPSRLNHHFLMTLSAYRAKKERAREQASE